MPGLRNGAVPDLKVIKRLTSRQIAFAMARAALGCKAEDVAILDLRRLSFSFDFFVLCSATSSTRIRTIVEDVEEKLFRYDQRPGHSEGKGQEGWVLLDYGPVVLHIFSPETREFYALERLWADATRVSVPSLRKHPARALSRR